MTENWIQFSLYPPGCRNTRQPLQVLYAFLPMWLDKNHSNINRWHCLFEPSALVRCRSPNPTEVLNSAKEIAKECGLVMDYGDCSAETNKNLAWPGLEYHGEAEFYGDEMWEANTKFMQACSELAIEVSKQSNKKQVWYLRKFAHLFANAMGMNYLEEVGFCQQWGQRALELYSEYGRS